jgi:hypothetical protein
MEIRPRNTTRLISSIIPLSISFRIARYIARNITIIDVESLFPPGILSTITTLLRFLPLFMRN